MKSNLPKQQNVAPQSLPSNAPYFLREPLEFDEARAAARDVAKARRDVVKQLEEAVGEFAAAEADYHKAKATAMVMLTAGGGVGVTEAQERVKGEVRDELLAREDAKNKVMILQEKLESIDGERASLHRLIEWSQRLGMNE